MFLDTTIQQGPTVLLHYNEMDVFLGKFDHRVMCPDIGIDNAPRKLRLVFCFLSEGKGGEWVGP